MKDLHAFCKHRWITPKAKAKKSLVHGWGVVATKKISKGEIVGILGGVIIPRSMITQYYKKIGGHLGIQINDNFFICPTTRKELKETGAFNHSCEPNIGYLNCITLIAIRNIKLGEELCLDYAFSETAFQPFKCYCDARNCRKTIRPSDWKIKKIQKIYKNYFSDYLKRKLK